MEIVLSGDLTIERAAAIRADLLQSIARDRSTTVRIEQAGRVHVSLFQLLCSAHRTAVSENRRLVLIQADSPRFHEQMKEAGFQRHVGCALDCHQSCLWVDADSRQPHP